jgi:hypothetical protein
MQAASLLLVDLFASQEVICSIALGQLWFVRDLPGIP